MSDLFSPTVLLALAGLWLLMMNAGAFSAFAADKRRAAERRQRYSERGLLTLVALGGSPGAWLAMQLFRHKTRKRSFQVTFWTIVTLQAAAAALVWWRL
jgi:uncharacterized membrane protein YsdA (DUF1294 family)